MSYDIGINAVLNDLDLFNASIKTTDFLMEVFEIFEKDKGIPGIIVYKDNTFYRMLSRTRFYEAMSKKFMFELFSKRTVYSFFDENEVESNLFLPIGTSILAAANEALKREERFRHDPIIVELENKELKLLDFHNLLLAQTQVHMLTLKSLTEANEFKKEVLGIAAHDLRNPINSILGFANLIIESEVYNNDVISFAEYIHKGASQMNELLSDLLISAANDATEIDIVRSAFNINTLVRSTIFSFEHALSAKRQSANFDTCKEELFVNADKQKLKEVLENLISNAIKYSEFDTIIRIIVKEDNNSIIIKVQDNGPGLTDDDLNKMFGKFQRLSARPTGNESSTGLGLYIVKKIVDKHGGQIAVDSRLGLGSSFKVILPNTITDKNLHEELV
ncbi:MAG: ATP-binding protein [Ignavibacteriaceae bacterium]|nr:ATP-binding protein [Ignavibacteriaceae bacterium]